MANVTLYVPSGVSTVEAPGGPYAPAANGTISVPPGPALLALLTAGCQLMVQGTDSVTINAPLASELVAIVAAAAPTSGTAMTIAAQPDYPCKLNVRGVYSGAVAGLVVNIVGVDGRGNAVSESVNVAAASSTTFVTANAYSKVTSITPVGTVTNVTTIGVGHSAALALPLSPVFTDLVVYKEGLSATAGAITADEAVGTVDTVAGTIIPTTAPNGTKSFTFWFSWNSPTL
ncbi:MAG TPA: hypothetical protein VET26_10120 [Candidatus Sulfotelmatobacter sp.]|nr:hypothetical protein [Candidatus Sulfotelmatobacter sp.]